MHLKNNVKRQINIGYRNRNDAARTMFDLDPIIAKYQGKVSGSRFRYDKSRLNEEYMDPIALAALEDTLPDLGITSR